MRTLLCKLWKDERGTLLVTDWVFVAAILVLGILPTVLSIQSRVYQTSVQVKSWSTVSPVASDCTETVD